MSVRSSTGSCRSFRRAANGRRYPRICRRARVMIQKFVTTRGKFLNELLDLNHTRRVNGLVSLRIPKFATERAAECKRTSESGN
jgi:hypothetical protein